MNITRSLTIGPKAQALKVSPFSEPRLEPSLAHRVGTLLFFHSGAIYHVHRKHGALTRNLSTNTATADNLKHTSDSKTLSFTRNDPLQDSGKTRTPGKTRTRLFSGSIFAEYASVFFSFIPIILSKKNAIYVDI